MRDRSLNVLAHELPVEVAPQRVVDEGLLLLVRLGPGAVLEDDVVVPTTLDLQAGLVGCRRGSVLFAKQRVARQNVLHPEKQSHVD